MNEFHDRFEIAAHPANAGLARDRVRRLAERAGFSGMDLADIEIAAGEAVTNAILYGSPAADSAVTVTGGIAAGAFFIEVRDRGTGFDPHHVRPDADQDTLGGRGIRLMRALMDQVDLYYGGDGMVAHLTKRLGR